MVTQALTIDVLGSPTSPDLGQRIPRLPHGKPPEP